MTSARLLAPLAAVALAVAAPALAQHDGHGGDMHAQKDGAAIAEGTVKNGVRTFQMQVTGDGFVPARVKAKKGEKVRFVITRMTDRTCAKEIVMTELGINQPLPLEKPVTVEFTPKKSGELKYACGMDMITGVVFVP
jgi:plastocyanin domain-containing protein